MFLFKIASIWWRKSISYEIGWIFQISIILYLFFWTKILYLLFVLHFIFMWRKIGKIEWQNRAWGIEKRKSEGTLFRSQGREAPNPKGIEKDRSRIGSQIKTWTRTESGKKIISWRTEPDRNTNTQYGIENQKIGS